MSWMFLFVLTLVGIGYVMTNADKLSQLCKGLGRELEFLAYKQGLDKKRNARLRKRFNQQKELEEIRESEQRIFGPEYRAPGTCECGGHIGCCGTRGG